MDEEHERRGSLRHNAFFGTILRIVVSVFFFLAGHLFLRFDDYVSLSLASFFTLILVDLTSFRALIKWVGFMKGSAMLLIIGTMSLCVEAIAIVTGLPYGRFSYSDALGLRFLDIVPMSVAFAYLPMLLGAVTVAIQLAGRSLKRSIAVSVVVLVLFDLVIEPAALTSGLWSWSEVGIYYGVPVSNFLGWCLTGTIYSTIFLIMVRKNLLSGTAIPVDMMASSLFIVSLWTGFILRFDYPMTLMIGFILIFTLISIDMYSSGRAI